MLKVRVMWCGYGYFFLEMYWRWLGIAGKLSIVTVDAVLCTPVMFLFDKGS